MTELCEPGSLRHLMLHEAKELDVLSKQIIDLLLNRDRCAPDGDTLNHLALIFNEKQGYLKSLCTRAAEYQDRERLIRQLEACSLNRDEVMKELINRLKVAEMALTTAVFQANEKLRILRQVEQVPVDSEEVIKFAHQISKNYSVAAPHYWQQGDPSRPFPTDNDFRVSHLAAPRQAPAQPNTLNLLKQNILAGQHSRTPQNPGVSSGPGGSRLSSPMTNTVKQQPWPPGQGTPPHQRTPTGFPAARGSNRGSLSLSRSSENSPQLSTPTVTVSGTPILRIQPVQNVEQMSSDSSSSSSSDEDSPK